MLDSLDQWTFSGFLIATMLSLGLRTPPAEFAALLTDRNALSRTLLANYVAVPLLALAIVRFLPLSRESEAAIVILSLVPGGLSALMFTSKVKGEEASATALAVFLSALSILVSPLLLLAILPEQADPAMPWPRVLAVYVLLMLAPLAAGMLLRRRLTALPAGLLRVLGVVSAVLFLAFIFGTKKFRWQAVLHVGWAAAGAMMLFILGAMAAGWFLGGPNPARRQILASATSMRNAALALAIAQESPMGSVVLPPMLAFSLLMVTPNKLFSLWHTWRAKRKAQPG
jgi:BASS family bile acid:Na+ symporter